jgi:hypothetical protein
MESEVSRKFVAASAYGKDLSQQVFDSDVRSGFCPKPWSHVSTPKRPKIVF